MILIIDNYDSFVYNLARYVVELGYESLVVRNDQITIQEVCQLNPEYIIISPGPCTPTEAGISIELIKQLGMTTPILGVCLGHQAIAQAFGAKIIRANEPMHGKSSPIQHNKQGIFTNIPNPIEVARYHSLIVEQESLSGVIEVTARSQNDEIMALQHREFPIYGVQFHPESILTQHGYKLLSNFLKFNTIKVGKERCQEILMS